MSLRPAICLAILAAACSSPLEPGRDRVLASIAGYNHGDPQVAIGVAPNAVRVTVVSYGGGCHQKGEADLEIGAGSVMITPHDYVERRPVCTRELNSFFHEVTIPAAVGPLTVRIRGIDASTISRSNPTGDTIVVERTLIIQ